VSSMRTSVTHAPGLAQAGVAEIQRSRLLTAAVRVCDERGYANTSVADIVSRSHVSRRTFYEMFSSREECFLEVLEQALAQIEAELARADLGALSWRERMRAGLYTILSFFDREPVLARVCVVHALGGGPEVLARRREIVARLVRAVDRGRPSGRRRDGAGELRAEGVVGAVFAIVYARLSQREHAPLAELLGELTGMIVLPYLGAAAAARERQRPAPKATPRGASANGARAAREPAAADPLETVPMRVTYRTAKVLDGLLELPGASNRQIGERAGISDPGQISKLLRRLARIGLIDNGGGGHQQGEPNAWRLTARGEQVAHSIRRHALAGDRQVM